MPNRLASSTARIYRMRELNQHAGEVLRDLHRFGQPALVTKNGRFIAVLTPLTGGVSLEAAALSGMPLEDPAEPAPAADEDVVVLSPTQAAEAFTNARGDDDLADEADTEGSDPPEWFPVSMRELSQHTTEVFRQIVERDLSAVITKHGRFVALLTPLDPGSIEQYVLKHTMKDIALGEVLLGRHAAGEAELRLGCD